MDSLAELKQQAALLTAQILRMQEEARNRAGRLGVVTDFAVSANESLGAAELQLTLVKRQIHDLEAAMPPNAWHG